MMKEERCPFRTNTSTLINRALLYIRAHVFFACMCLCMCMHVWQVIFPQDSLTSNTLGMPIHMVYIYVYTDVDTYGTKGIKWRLYLIDINCIRWRLTTALLKEIVALLPYRISIPLQNIMRTLQERIFGWKKNCIGQLRSTVEKIFTWAPSPADSPWWQRLCSIQCQHSPILQFGKLKLGKGWKLQKKKLKYIQ